MSVKVRFGDGGINDIDEIVTGKDTMMHLERMDTALWCLILYTPTSRSHFSIHKKGKEVVGTTVEVDMTEGYDSFSSSPTPRKAQGEADPQSSGETEHG
jgi:hypothetical protein